MSAYDSLSIFDDVRPALQRLPSHPHITPVISSNGTYDMVSASVNRSPDLAPYASLFHKIVVVEEPCVFKPAAQVYRHLASQVGKVDHKGQWGMQDMWLVSGNPFDIVGARAVGMHAAWVDRAGGGWVDRLVDGPEGSPSVVVKNLGHVVDAVTSQSGAR